MHLVISGDNLCWGGKGSGSGNERRGRLVQLEDEGPRSRPSAISESDRPEWRGSPYPLVDRDGEERPDLPGKSHGRIPRGPP